MLIVSFPKLNHVYFLKTKITSFVPQEMCLEHKGCHIKTENYRAETNINCTAQAGAFKYIQQLLILHTLYVLSLEDSMRDEFFWCLFLYCITIVST